MDKLSKHAIRMLEIVDGENDFFRNDSKRQADIARAVYDTILQVQMLKVADRKTENCSEKPNNCETCRFELYCPEMCEGCCEWDSHYEPKTEPQIFTWGKEVHEYCKRNCGESKVRTRGGDRFIVCGQANDEICISLWKCPLDKWVAGEGFHILPMDEPQTERSE